MYTTLLVSLLAAFAPLAATQGAAGALPACAQSCIGDSIQKTGCQLIDYNCICSKQELISGLACCVGKVCSQADIAQTLKFANGICAQAQPPVSIQQQATCASTAAGGPATPTPTTPVGTGSTPTPTPTTAPTGTGAPAGTGNTGAQATGSSPSTALAAPTNRVEVAAGFVGAAIAAGAFFL